MTDPFFSIVIPAYNASATIRRCLDSVASQTDKSFEIIVVDDGSEDETSDTINEWSEQNTGVSILCLRKANEGPASARNEAIRNAKGQFICFLDADDCWLPEKLSVIREKIEEAGGRVDVFTHDVTFIENESERPMRCGPNRSYEEMLRLGNCLITSATVVKKSALMDVGLLNDQKAYIGIEDFDLWLKLLHAKYSITYIHQPLAKYWVMSSSLSQDFERITAHHHCVVETHLSTFNYSPGRKSKLLRISDCNMYRNIARRLQITGQHERAAVFFKKALLKNPLSAKTWILSAGNLLKLQMRSPSQRGRPQ
jgi:teichuronic acid biosynthesis glycosyltransferase TuaG